MENGKMKKMEKQVKLFDIEAKLFDMFKVCIVFVRKLEQIFQVSKLCLIK